VNGGGIGGTDSFSNIGAGGLAGGQIGCNYQIRQFVVGIEGEGDWSSMQSGGTTGIPGASTSTTVRNHWDADVAMRFGFAWGETFGYAKVGAVWLGDHYDITAPGASTTGNTTLPGFLFGLGAEYAFAPQWTAKAEINIDFVNSNSISLSCSGAACGVASTLSSDSQVVVLGKIGVNYRF
jgi:outer membrane immunogenic protein